MMLTSRPRGARKRQSLLKQGAARHNVTHKVRRLPETGNSISAKYLHARSEQADAHVHLQKSTLEVQADVS
jgi:hypothetical protein